VTDFAALNKSLNPDQFIPSGDDRKHPEDALIWLQLFLKNLSSGSLKALRAQ